MEASGVSDGRLLRNLSIGEIDVDRYLATGQFEEVLCGGENYDGSRPCHYEWVKKLSDQCRRYDATFDFIETGTVFVKDVKYLLSDPEPSIFEVPEYEPVYRDHCKTCGTRMTCNGCSNCGACE